MSTVKGYAAALSWALVIAPGTFALSAPVIILCLFVAPHPLTQKAPQQPGTCSPRGFGMSFRRQELFCVPAVLELHRDQHGDEWAPTGQCLWKLGGGTARPQTWHTRCLYCCSSAFVIGPSEVGPSSLDCLRFQWYSVITVPCCVRPACQQAMHSPIQGITGFCISRFRNVHKQSPLACNLGCPRLGYHGEGQQVGIPRCSALLDMSRESGVHCQMPWHSNRSTFGQILPPFRIPPTPDSLLISPKALCYVCSARNVFWWIEQPTSSFFFKLPFIAEMMKRCQASDSKQCHPVHCGRRSGQTRCNRFCFSCPGREATSLIS